MKTIIASFVILSLAWTAAAQQSIVDQFERRSHTHDGFTLPYRLFVPVDYDSTTAYPLVLALHGAGERGTDNERHIALHRLATSWADPVNQAVNPAFVVAPQVPPGGRWTADLPVDESDFNQPELTTLAILDSLAIEFNIDPERIYVTGLSMGGHGAWDLISRLPDRFAAAVPMSGNADPMQALRLLHIPIWTFHGESDTVVRPFGARSLVQEMENLGRDVVYTDCRRAPPTRINFDCPGAMSNTTLAVAIDDHADLIYTGARNVGHGPWNVWYDHPLLAGWLFSKQRVDPDVITIQEPSKGSVWSMTNGVTWTSAGPATDTVEVWLSTDDGSTWEQLGVVDLGAGSYDIDTSAHPDAAVARIRLFLRNGAGRIYGRGTSAAFTIDNDGDSAPYLSLDDESLRFDPQVTSETLALSIVAADPEGLSLDAEIFYSVDGGVSFGMAEARQVTSSVETQTVDLDVAALPNSARAKVRIEVSDGTGSAVATTALFVKETPRLVNDYVQRVAGDGVGTITLHFVEPASLTNHRYRISFDNSDPSGKTYAVEDLDLSTTVLESVPLSDGVLESPIFDGMSLVVEDLAVGMANLEKTGWIEGDSDLGVSIVGGSVLIAVLRVQLLETETDYEIKVSDVVADTSVAMFGMPARELYFTVTSRTDGERRKVLYKDVAGDDRLGGGDVLYILEEDSDGELAPAWELRFMATAETVLPVGGDTFLFVPLHKLGPDDVFEFIAMLGVNVDETAAKNILTLQHFPNPFGDRTTIAYTLSKPSQVTLEIFDVLGRRVMILANETVLAGEHRVAWSGNAARGSRTASGHYVIRLVARPLDGSAVQSAEHVAVMVR